MENELVAVDDSTAPSLANQFDIVDVDSMSYQETVLIYAPLILEVSVGGSDISRIVAEISSQLTP